MPSFQYKADGTPERLRTAGSLALVQERKMCSVISAFALSCGMQQGDIAQTAPVVQLFGPTSPGLPPLAV